MPEGFLPTSNAEEYLCIHACILMNKCLSLRVNAGDDLHINYEAMLESNAALETSL